MDEVRQQPVGDGARHAQKCTKILEERGTELAIGFVWPSMTSRAVLHAGYSCQIRHTPVSGRRWMKDGDQVIRCRLRVAGAGLCTSRSV